MRSLVIQKVETSHNDMQYHTSIALSTCACLYTFCTSYKTLLLGCSYSAAYMYCLLNCVVKTHYHVHPQVTFAYDSADPPQMYSKATGGLAYRSARSIVKQHSKTREKHCMKDSFGMRLACSGASWVTLVQASPSASETVSNCTQQISSEEPRCL